MDLDPQIATSIVTNLKDIIQHEINLFDTTGTIIASTDSARIGTSHDGARLAISTRDTVFINEENEFKGAKHGINVPVLFNDAVVAVIGITGECSEVEPFGNVIKKMTEILIRENWEQITRFDQRERLTNLVNLLSLEFHDSELLNYLASVLEVDLSIPRRAVVGVIINNETSSPSSESPYSIIYSRFHEFKNSFFSVSDQEIHMYVDEQDEHRLANFITGIQEDISEQRNQLVAFGIGSRVNSADTYWRSYDEARKTVDWLLFTRADTVGNYETMDYGIFLSSIPQSEALLFSQRVFGNLSEKEIDEYETIFKSYTQHNGSILHCAEALYLHKNTLQNRLNKMTAMTGHNPRELSDFALLSLAFILRRYAKYSATSYFRSNRK